MELMQWYWRQILSHCLAPYQVVEQFSTFFFFFLTLRYQIGDKYIRTPVISNLIGF